MHRGKNESNPGLKKYGVEPHRSFSIRFLKKDVIMVDFFGFSNFTEKAKVVLGNLHKFLCWESWRAGVVMLIRYVSNLS